MGTCVLAVSFSDLSTEHWAYKNITSLAEKGVVNGYEDGTYRPEREVTRAEFIKLIMSALHDEPNYYKAIEGDTHWAQPFVREALNHDYLMNGTQEDSLDIPITRLEMAHMLAKISVSNEISNYVEGADNITFSDIAELDQVSRTYIMNTVYNGFVSGYPDGTFGPDRTMTRAECATIIARFLNAKTNVR